MFLFTSFKGFMEMTLTVTCMHTCSITQVLYAYRYIEVFGGCCILGSL